MNNEARQVLCIAFAVVAGAAAVAVMDMNNGVYSAILGGISVLFVLSALMGESTPGRAGDVSQIVNVYPSAQPQPQQPAQYMPQPAYYPAPQMPQMPPPPQYVYLPSPPAPQPYLPPQQVGMQPEQVMQMIANMQREHRNEMQQFAALTHQNESQRAAMSYQPQPQIVSRHMGNVVDVTPDGRYLAPPHRALSAPREEPTRLKSFIKALTS